MSLSKCWRALICVKNLVGVRFGMTSTINICQALALCFLLCTAFIFEARANPRADIKFYADTYGLVDINSLPRARTVFDKVLAVADRNDKYWPRLAIVNDTQRPAVFALSDGHIVISKKALDIIYTGVSERDGDTRLAFVVGHELSHLATDDFWDESVSAALTSSVDRELSEAIYTSQPIARQKKELRADESGFLYAAIAGYPVHTLLDLQGVGESFLNFWASEVGEKSDANYPSAKYRTEVLRTRLSEKMEYLDYYYWGVRLANLGYYDDAIRYLTEFQKIFPSREVFNNIALCYLNKATSLMDSRHAYHYWLPAITDTHTLLNGLAERAEVTRSGNGFLRKPNPAIKNLLSNAIVYLNRSIDKDASYVPAYMNLATAHFYLSFESYLQNDHITESSITIEKAYQRQPENFELEVARAIILSYDQYGRARYNSLIKDLIARATSEQVSIPAYYNLIRLLIDNPVANNEMHIDKFYNMLVGDISGMPRVLRSLLCKESLFQKKKEALVCDGLEQEKPPVSRLALPFEIGRDLLERPITRTESHRYTLKKKTLFQDNAYYSEGFSMLALDNIISVFVSKNMSAKKIGIGELAQYDGAIIGKQDLGRDSLWRYRDWVAVIRDRKRIGELWFSGRLPALDW